MHCPPPRIAFCSIGCDQWRQNCKRHSSFHLLGALQALLAPASGLAGEHLRHPVAGSAGAAWATLKPHITELKQELCRYHSRSLVATRFPGSAVAPFRYSPDLSKLYEINVYKLVSTVFSKFAAVSLASIALTACGGGDGGGSSASSPSPSPSPPAPTPAPPRTEPCFKLFGDDDDCVTRVRFNQTVEEFTESIRDLLRDYEIEDLGNYNWARESVNAYKAYAHLALALSVEGGGAAAGQGVDLGFIDTGLHLDHPEFVASGRGSTDYVHIDSLPLDDFEEGDHGTAVVGAAAGFLTGIAYAADVIMFGSRNPYSTGGDFVDLDEDSWFQVFDHDLDILNLSWGVPATTTFNLSTYPIDKFANRAFFAK